MPFDESDRRLRAFEVSSLTQSASVTCNLAMALGAAFARVFSHGTKAGTVTTTHGWLARRARNALAVPVPCACEAAQPPRPLTNTCKCCGMRRVRHRNAYGLPG